MLLLGGCHRPASTPPPPAPIAVPRGCERTFTGAWTHTQDKTFHYQLSDDGHTLVLLAQRLGPAAPRGADAGVPDAGLSSAVRATTPNAGADAGGVARGDAGVNAQAPEPVRVVLERTSHGFVGEVQAQVELPDHRCEVTFPAEVLACSADEIRLRVTPSRSVDPTCATAPLPPAPWAEHRIRRDLK